MADSDKQDLRSRIKRSIADYNRLFDQDTETQLSKQEPGASDGPKGAGRDKWKRPKGKGSGVPVVVGTGITDPEAFLRKAARRYLGGDWSHVRAAAPALGPIDSPPMGVEGCPHYLGDNRMAWWDIWEDPETAAKIATSPMTTREGFKCEFHPTLRGVVTFDSLGDGQSPNDLPGKQFAVLSRGHGAPVIRRRDVTHEDDAGARVRDVVSVIVNEDPRGPGVETGETERPVLVVAFDGPQRAVGLDYGFLTRDADLPPPPEDAIDISTRGVELRAYTRDGEFIVNSHGSDMAEGGNIPRWVDHNTVTKRIGVRDSQGQIGYVELHFGRRSAHNPDAPGAFITEPQVVYRVWHEPFPTAAVRQGEVTREEIQGKTETLPFHCDKAAAFLRGFKVGFDGQAHEVSTMAFGLESTLRGRQIVLEARGRLGAFADDTPADRVKVYYTLVAWDSERAELYAPSGRADLAQFVDEGATSRGVVTVPDPCVIPAHIGPRTQPATSAELCGPVWAGLTEFEARFWEDSELDTFGFHGDPALRTAGDTLSWPVHTEMEDAENYNSAVGGQFLTGRSLRLGPDGMPFGTGLAAGGQPFPVAVDYHGERPANGPDRYYWDGPQSIDYGIAWPIRAEVAFLSVWEWLGTIKQGFFKGDGPIRDVEWELKATDYDGSIVQWTQGGGVSTHDVGDDGDHNGMFGWPTFAGVIPKSSFASPSLAVQDLRFENAVVDAVSLVPTRLGAVINQGDAPVFLTRARLAGDDPGSFMVVMAVTRMRVWEGVDLLVEGEALGRVLRPADLETGPPVQLLPGEALLIGGRFLPLEQRNQSAWLHISTSDSRTPTVAVSLIGHVVPSQAEWDLAPGHVNFDQVSVGQARVRRAVIASVGQTPLLIYRVRIKDPAKGFSIGGGAEIGGEGGHFQLQPGSVYLLEITFRPIAEGPADSKITVETNAGERSAFLHGTGE